MYDPTSNEFKPITEEMVKDAQEPVFSVGSEVTLNGLIFTICAIKKKKLILKVKGKCQEKKESNMEDI